MTGYRSGRGYGGYAVRRPPAPKPVTSRASWVTMLDFALAAFASPNETPHDFAHSLRGLKADNFPVERGDRRANWAKAFLDQAHLWVEAGTATRTAFAGGLIAHAAVLKDFLIEQGAAVAAASRHRMGLED
jgi:hypothetical protein